MRIDEFILARVSEDEAVARDAIREIGRIEWVSEFAKPSITSAGPLWCDPDGMGVHVATEPARVLAECEAKRRVVELHAPKDPDPYASWKSPEYHEAQRKSWAADGLHYDPNKWLACAECEHKYPCRTLKHLAAVYADHPDFDPAWRL